jgi:hypothetical protein
MPEPAESPLSPPVDQSKPIAASGAGVSGGGAGGTSAGPAGGAVRARDDKGHFLPRPPEPGSEAGAVPAPKAQPPRPPAKARITTKPGRKAENLERTSLAKKARASREAARRASEAITQMMVTAATIAFGEEAEPSAALRERINGPQARILERMDPEALDLVAKYTDPLELAMAYTEWGAQIWRVVEAQRKARAARTKAATGAPAAGVDKPLKMPPEELIRTEEERGDGREPAELFKGESEPATLGEDGEAEPYGKQPGRAVTIADIQSEMGQP